MYCINNDGQVVFKTLLIYMISLCSPRSALTDLKVDPAALFANEKSGKVKGLIITMIGIVSSEQCSP